MAILQIKGTNRDIFAAMTLEGFSEVTDNMVLAAAKIGAEEQRKESRRLRKDVLHDALAKDRNETVYGKGYTADSVTVGKVKEVKGEKRVSVHFRGTRPGRPDQRSAEIAYVNEYGSHTVRKRGQIRRANARAEKPAQDAAEKIYDEWLKGKG